MVTILLLRLRVEPVKAHRVELAVLCPSPGARPVALGGH